MFINSMPRCKELILTMPIRPYDNSELYDEEDQIDKYEKTISYLDYNLHTLTNKIDELENENDDLKEEIHSLYQKISDLL